MAKTERPARPDDQVCAVTCNHGTVLVRASSVFGWSHCSTKIVGPTTSLLAAMRSAGTRIRVRCSADHVWLATSVSIGKPCFYGGTCNEPLVEISEETYTRQLHRARKDAAAEAGRVADATPLESFTLEAITAAVT